MRPLSGQEISRRLGSAKGTGKVGAAARQTQAAALATKTVSEWVWERVPEEARAKDRAKERLDFKLSKAAEAKPFGWEVGVGAEIGHLNKRKQRRRLERVSKDVELMTAIESARKVARGQAKQKAAREAELAAKVTASKNPAASP
jgi:hypothetical protein